MDNSERTYEFDAFVSYSDNPLRDRVRRLVDRLRKDGLIIWYDKDELVGGDSLERINLGLSKSRSLVLCLSSGIDPFGRVTHEFSYFHYSITPARRVIPVRTDEALEPVSLRQYVSIDWRNDSDEGYEKIRRSIQRDVEAKPMQLPPSPDAICMSGLPFHLSGWNGRYEKTGERKNGRAVWERPEHWYKGLFPLRIIGVRIWFDGRSWVLHRNCDAENVSMARSKHSDDTPKVSGRDKSLSLNRYTAVGERNTGH